jgi:hypothetical protein
MTHQARDGRTDEPFTPRNLGFAHPEEVEHLEEQYRDFPLAEALKAWCEDEYDLPVDVTRAVHDEIERATERQLWGLFFEDRIEIVTRSEYDDRVEPAA